MCLSPQRGVQPWGRILHCPQALGHSSSLPSHSQHGARHQTQMPTAAQTAPSRPGRKEDMTENDAKYTDTEMHTHTHTLMHSHSHTHTCVPAHTLTHAFAHMQHSLVLSDMHTCMHTQVCTHVCTRTHICVHSLSHAHTCTCSTLTHALTLTCTYTHNACTHMYTRTHTHRSQAAHWPELCHDITLLGGC